MVVLKSLTKYGTLTRWETGLDHSSTRVIWDVGHVDLFADSISELIEHINAKLGLSIHDIYVPDGETFREFRWSQIEGDDGMAFEPHEEAQWRLGRRVGFQCDYVFELADPMSVRDLVASGFDFRSKMDQ